MDVSTACLGKGNLSRSDAEPEKAPTWLYILKDAPMNWPQASHRKWD